jgi:hypothetical protein
MANTNKLITSLILTLCLFGIAPHDANADTRGMHDRLDRLEEAVRELHLALLKKRNIPRLVNVVPQDAEIGEAVLIKGEGFRGPVDIYFDTYVGVTEIEPVDENLLAFRVPESFKRAAQCTTTEKARVCVTMATSIKPDFETYDIRVKTDKGFSNSLKLEIVEEK